MRVSATTYCVGRALYQFVLREFLGQAWMKEDKKERAANICLITERFNDVSFFLHFSVKREESQGL